MKCGPFLFNLSQYRLWYLRLWYLWLWYNSQLLSSQG